MISKNKLKLIRSLESKKHRDATGLFVAEGPKVVADIMKLHPSNLRMLLATPQWLENANVTPGNYETVEATEAELARASFLCHPQQVMGVFGKMQPQNRVGSLAERLSLVLDGVQDPGNLGTIIRIADWFGIEDVICSPDTADVFNPKVVQATMGSIARVNVSYMPLQQLFDIMPQEFPIYGTLLEGSNIYTQELSPTGFIVMGNEGKGLSAPVRHMVNKSLRIPNFPEQRDTADSLNVAIATAVVCAEFRRRQG